MSSVAELFPSRVGSSIGSDGVNLSRLFLVLTDVPTDDPVRVLQNDRSNGIPYQSANPWNLDTKAMGYSIVQRLGKLAWKVQVAYELPNVISPERSNVFPGWEVQIRGGGEQERLLQELAPNLADPDASPRIVGPPHYKEADPVNEPNFKTYKNNEDGTGTEAVYLYDTGQRIPVGWTRSLPSMELTLTKDAKDLSLLDILSAHGYLKMVNDQNFYGGGRGHVRFDNIILSSRAAEIEQRPEHSGIRIPSQRWGIQRHLVFRVSLIFNYSVKRWDRKQEAHIWEDKDGAQSLVYKIAAEPGDEEAAVQEEFRTGVAANFMALLRIFN